MVNKKQIEIMSHAIGLNSRRKMPYRNYYNTGSQKPENLENLVELGYAYLRETDKQMGGNYYHVTTRGLQLILDNKDIFGLDKRIKMYLTLDEKCNGD